MNMMNQDFRPERERKPLEDLIRQALTAYLDRAADDEDMAETVRAFMIESDEDDYRDVPDVVFGQLLLRTDLPRLLTDMSVRLDALIQYVGANCFDEIDERTMCKSSKLSALLDDAHDASTRFRSPEGLDELFSVLMSFKPNRTGSADQTSKPASLKDD